MEKGEGRRKRLLDNLMENKIYWKLKAEARDRTLWKTRFGKVMDLSHDNTRWFKYDRDKL